MSPGTSCATASSCCRPSRSTLARTETDSRSRSAAALARRSCTKSSVTLSSTIAAMMTKLVTSPVSAEMPLASSRISTSGLRKCSSSWRHAGGARWSRKRFGPYCSSRACASVCVRPSWPASLSGSSHQAA